MSQRKVPRPSIAWPSGVAGEGRGKHLPAITVTAVRPVLPFALLLGSLLPLAEAQVEPMKPNIIFFLSDDQGIDGVGCYGSDRFKGKTPNLDLLAQTGLRFERCYSLPVCGPSRCQYMMGRYPFRTGALTSAMSAGLSPKDEFSIARLLKQTGYATGQCGKWSQMAGTPSDWGYDEYLTDRTAMGWYWEKEYIRNGDLVRSEEDIYCPDAVQAFAVDFLRRHREEPFFLYYATHLVHDPILKTPDTIPGTEGMEALYDDNIAYLDKQVGQLVAELDRLGLREKTLILFSGDNGTARYSGTIGGRQIDGAKGSMQEGGVRVPLIANWRGVTPEGKNNTDLVDFSDFYATLAELAGAQLPDGVTLDSRSFAPQLRGEEGNPREWVFVQLGAEWYVREDGWKLNQAGQLFDMKDAPFVELPVAVDTKEEAAAAARQRLKSVLDELDPAAGPVALGRAELRREFLKQRRKDKQK